MRCGEVSSESDRILRSLSRVPEMTKMSNLEATHLFPLRNEVERHNTQKLNSLAGELVTLGINIFDF